MPDVPNGLGRVEDLLGRFKKAEEEYNLWRSIHQDAAEYSMPNRETFKQHSPGQRKNRQIFDSTAVVGLQQFGSRIQGALMPPWQQWMDLVAGDDIPEDEKDRVNEALEDITKTFFSHLNHSNFYTELAPSLLDLGIGTGAILVEEEEFGKSNILRFTNVPLAELYIPNQGDDVWRKQSIKPSLIKRTWPRADFGSDLQKLADKEESDNVDIINGMVYNTKDGLYHQVVIYQKSLIYTQSFKSKRLITFRWSRTPGEGYGRGPVIQNLPDILTVNKMKEFVLRNAALQMSGVYTGVDDGIFNPHTVRIAPGSVIPVSSNQTANPSLRPLDRSGDLGLGSIVMEDLQMNIRKALFADPMGELTDPVRSATEIMLRNQEMLQSQGASFGRQKTELIEPLVNAVIEILQDRGKMPELKVDGREVTIRQTSPLAKSESMENFQNSQVWFSTVAQLDPAIVAGSVKVEELPRYWQETLGVPADLVRTEQEREEIAQAAQQAAQEQGLVEQ